MDAAGVIAYYVMDGNRPLTVTTGSDTTSYLYGLGVIGEESNAWSYGLTDGTNTQRQLTDALGDVTYSARYTPWGDTLESSGTGNLAFGYFGGLMDAATGLLYVGDGQYYDPSTGRFLTRNARPNSANPYLPFDPTGALFLPLALVSLVYGRKRRKSKWDILVIVTLLSLSVGMGVAACGNVPQGEVTATVTATPGAPIGVGTATFANGATQQALVSVTPTGTPTILVTKEIPCTLTTGDSIPGKLPYGGNEVMGLYNMMKDYKDGWWYKHPKIKFSFEVFVGIMMDHEAAGIDIQQRLTAEVIAQQLYVGGWRPAYCSIGQCSENAIANNLAANSESIWRIINRYVRSGEHISTYLGYGDRGKDQPHRAVENGKKIGYAALHPASLNYDKDNALSVYGNDEAWVVKIINESIKGEIKRYAYQEYRDGGPRSIYYFTPQNDGSAVYASVNQYRCWKEGNYCSVVPDPIIVNYGGN
jgi:RHS repeat-associated protein